MMKLKKVLMILMFLFLEINLKRMLWRKILKSLLIIAIVAVAMIGVMNPNVFGEARLELHQPALGLRVERFPGANHYIKQVEAFNDSIMISKPLVWTLEQARSTQQAIDTVLSVATAIT